MRRFRSKPPQEWRSLWLKVATLYLAVCARVFATAGYEMPIPVRFQESFGTLPGIVRYASRKRQKVLLLKVLLLTVLLAVWTWRILLVARERWRAPGFAPLRPAAYAGSRLDDLGSFAESSMDKLITCDEAPRSSAGNQYGPPSSTTLSMVAPMPCSLKNAAASSWAAQLMTGCWSLE